MASLTSAQMLQRSQKVASRQSELVSCVLEYLEDEDEDAAELGFYMFSVLCLMYEKACKTKLKRISGSKLARALERNEDFAGNLEDADERFIERVAATQLERQPHVMKYVVETILEPEDDEYVDLTEEAIGAIYLLMLSVIDVLDDALTKSERR